MRWAADWNTPISMRCRRFAPPRRAEQDRFSSVILAIVESDLFQKRTGERKLNHGFSTDFAADRSQGPGRVDRVAVPGGDGAAPSGAADAAAAEPCPGGWCSSTSPTASRWSSGSRRAKAPNLNSGRRWRRSSRFKSNMLVFSNLADANARGGGAHACTMPAYLSGVSDFQDAGQRHSRRQSPAIRSSPQNIGNATRFPSLELGCDFGQQDGFCEPAIAASIRPISRGVRRRRRRPRK